MILRLILSGGVCAVAGLGALSAVAEGARPYLSWPGKVAQSTGTQATGPRLEKTLPNPATGAPGFDIPQSPYGQVGSPYVSSAPKPVTAPVRPEVPRPADVPPPLPKVVSVVPSPAPLPEPVPLPQALNPQLQQAQVKTKPVVPAPVSPPVPQSVAQVPPVQEARAEEAPFVLPATSKYAVRPVAQPVPSEASPPPAAVSTATAPALSEPLIVPENESVFVPGMRVSDPATQAPRFYSLHRAYGYQPDPVEPQNGELKIDPSQVETKD